MLDEIGEVTMVKNPDVIEWLNDFHDFISFHDINQSNLKCPRDKQLVKPGSMCNYGRVGGELLASAIGILFCHALVDPSSLGFSCSMSCYVKSSLNHWI